MKYFVVAFNLLFGFHANSFAGLSESCPPLFLYTPFNIRSLNHKVDRLQLELNRHEVIVASAQAQLKLPEHLRRNPDLRNRFMKFLSLGSISTGRLQDELWKSQLRINDLIGRLNDFSGLVDNFKNTVNKLQLLSNEFTNQTPDEVRVMIRILEDRLTTIIYPYIHSLFDNSPYYYRMKVGIMDANTEIDRINSILTLTSDFIRDSRKFGYSFQYRLLELKKESEILEIKKEKRDNNPSKSSEDDITFLMFALIHLAAHPETSHSIPESNNVTIPTDIDSGAIDVGGGADFGGGDF